MRRRIATTGEKYLALTFDDGPSEFTPEILQVLSIHDVRATFFVLGENAAAMPEVVRSLVDAGHGVAIHGWNHSLLTELDPEVVAEDLCRTQGLVRELSGAECRDVRPPYGVFDEALLSCFDDRGLVTWLWTADARDWTANATADHITRKVLRSLTPGGIILLHDGGGDRSETRAHYRASSKALAQGDSAS